MESKERIFAQIRGLMHKHAKGLDERTDIRDSKAKSNKPQYHLYGKKQVSINGRKPQWVYVVGVTLNKNYVSFYSMPVYSHKKEFTIKSPVLKKAMKGKSCFNLTNLDFETLTEIDNLITKSIQLYKKERWI